MSPKIYIFDWRCTWKRSSDSGVGLQMVSSTDGHAVHRSLIGSVRLRKSTTFYSPSLSPLFTDKQNFGGLWRNPPPPRDSRTLSVVVVFGWGCNGGRFHNTLSRLHVATSRRRYLYLGQIKLPAIQFLGLLVLNFHLTIFLFGVNISSNLFLPSPLCWLVCGYDWTNRLLSLTLVSSNGASEEGV